MAQKRVNQLNGFNCSLSFCVEHKKLKYQSNYSSRDRPSNCFCIASNCARSISSFSVSESVVGCFGGAGSLLRLGGCVIKRSKHFHSILKHFHIHFFSVFETPKGGKPSDGVAHIFAHLILILSKRLHCML